MSVYYVTGGGEEFNLLDVFDVVRPKKIWLDRANCFCVVSFRNDSGRLREHFKACFLYRENLTKEK